MTFIYNLHRLVHVRYRSLYAIARPSVCLSVVCNVRAPYSGGWNFRQHFYGIWYSGHPLTSTENFTEIVPSEEPLRRGSKTRGVAKYSDFGPIEATSQKRCKIGGKLLLITTGSRIWAFDWYQNRWPWMALNGVMAFILRYFTEFGSFRGTRRKNGWRYT